MNNSPVYLDNASTTFVCREVQGAINDLWERKLGNPSSIHQLGVLASVELERARAVIARAIGAQPQEIYFTSGGTESNNLAIIGYFSGRPSQSQVFACSAIEHMSVLASEGPLSKMGVNCKRIGVDKSGRIRADELEKVLDRRPDLISIMHANNEVGTLQDLKVISDACRTRGIKLHVDACQSFTKVPINVKELSIDMLSICAHKIHGPRGMGALYIRKGVDVQPLAIGGGQEFGIRPGTVNVEGAVGFAKAVEVAERHRDQWDRIVRLRDQCADGCMEIGFSVVAEEADRLPNILNIYKAGLSAKDLMFELSKRNIFVSLGSACQAGKNSQSHVLTAMKLGAENIAGAIRVSLCRDTTDIEVSRFLETLKSCIRG